MALCDYSCDNLIRSQRDGVPDFGLRPGCMGCSRAWAWVSHVISCKPALRILPVGLNEIAGKNVVYKPGAVQVEGIVHLSDSPAA